MNSYIPVPMRRTPRVCLSNFSPSVIGALTGSRYRQVFTPFGTLVVFPSKKGSSGEQSNRLWGKCVPNRSVRADVGLENGATVHPQRVPITQYAKQVPLFLPRKHMDATAASVKVDPPPFFLKRKHTDTGNYVDGDEGPVHQRPRSSTGAGASDTSTPTSTSHVSGAPPGGAPVFAMMNSDGSFAQVPYFPGMSVNVPPSALPSSVIPAPVPSPRALLPASSGPGCSRDQGSIVEDDSDCEIIEMPPPPTAPATRTPVGLDPTTPDIPDYEDRLAVLCGSASGVPAFLDKQAGRDVFFGGIKAGEALVTSRTHRAEVAVNLCTLWVNHYVGTNGEHIFDKDALKDYLTFADACVFTEKFGAFDGTSLGTCASSAPSSSSTELTVGSPETAKPKRGRAAKPKAIAAPKKPATVTRKRQPAASSSKKGKERVVAGAEAHGDD